MIDLENEIYTHVSNYITTNYGSISISGEYSNTPDSFPHVSIVEEDNSVYENGIDSGNIENYSTLTYEFNIYSNKPSGRKQEAKDIASVIDQCMESLGFIRIVKTYISDSKVFRLITRYQAICPKENTDLVDFYRR